MGDHSIVINNLFTQIKLLITQLYWIGFRLNVSFQTKFILLLKKVQCFYGSLKSFYQLLIYSGFMFDESQQPKLQRIPPGVHDTSTRTGFIESFGESRRSRLNSLNSSTWRLETWKNKNQIWTPLDCLLLASRHSDDFTSMLFLTCASLSVPGK